MSTSNILDLLDNTNEFPPTPSNTVIDTFSDQEAELVMSPFLLNGRAPSRAELKKINQVITFSATESSYTPSLSSSSPRFSSEEKEVGELKEQVDFLKKEIRQYKYKVVCLDITNRELEEDNQKLNEELKDEQYEKKRMKREINKLREILSEKKETSNFIVYATVIGFVSTTSAIIFKCWRYLDNF